VRERGGLTAGKVRGGTIDHLATRLLVGRRSVFAGVTLNLYVAMRQHERDRATFESKEFSMTKAILAAIVLLFGVSFTTPAQQAATGTIISESSVACGTKTQGKKQSSELLCQQYTVRTETTEYQIRQPKPASKAIVPANTVIDFKIDKDKMKFTADGKKYEYLVVGTSAIGAK
jgi:hypothetical protein